ncbi:MAG: C39 family peptidase [Thermomicrobiaceae bacterium]
MHIAPAHALSPSPFRKTLLIASLSLLTILVACGDSEDEEGSDLGAVPTIQIDEPIDSSEPEDPDPTVTPQQEPTSVPEATAVEPSEESTEPEPTPQPEPTPTSEPEPTAEPEPKPEPLDLPDAAFLGGMTHMYQTMNNCSAASVCMLLSHYDIVLDQEQLRSVMRPNDAAKHGKYVYIIDYLREQGFRADLKHGGDIETIKAFVANDIPVVVQQWLELDSDPIGHYSVVRGYDDNEQVFRLNDSMHGEDFRVSYDVFVQKWRAFSYRFIPVYPESAQGNVDRILGEEVDQTINRQRTLEQIQAELQGRPEDPELIYSLGTNLHDLGRYGEAIEAYERAAAIGLPPKMLWYVYWPAEAYNEIGQHDRAIQVADQQIASAQTFGDMRYERARAIEALGRIDEAIAEYRQALVDDPKLQRAEDALVRLGAQ